MRDSIGPGRIALTLMHVPATSSAAVRVKPSTACLEATYPDNPARPRIAEVDAVLTIAPDPRGIIFASTYLQVREKRPSHSPAAGGRRHRPGIRAAAPTTPSIPALLANMPIGPNPASVTSTKPRALLRDSETSARIAIDLQPAASTRCAVCAAALSSISTTATALQSRASRNAMARPISPPPPVTSATGRPASSASGHDFRKSQPPSSSGRHASLGGMVWISL